MGTWRCDGAYSEEEKVSMAKTIKKISFIERWRDEGRRTATKIKTRMRTNDCSAAKEKG